MQPLEPLDDPLIERECLFIHVRETAANLLTNDMLDWYGKIPEFKYCAVRVEAVAYPT